MFISVCCYCSIWYYFCLIRLCTNYAIISMPYSIRFVCFCCLFLLKMRVRYLTVVPIARIFGNDVYLTEVNAGGFGVRRVIF
jgi:hypothetical protein